MLFIVNALNALQLIRKLKSISLFSDYIAEVMLTIVKVESASIDHEMQPKIRFLQSWNIRKSPDIRGLREFSYLIGLIYQKIPYLQ